MPMDSSVWKAIIQGVVAPLVGLLVWYLKTSTERKWKKEDAAIPATAPSPGTSAAAAAPGFQFRLIPYSQFVFWWPVWVLGCWR
jgi:hypothetical protein